MAYEISMNLGFVTNSSSVVHHVPPEVLQHPKVKSFLEAFEVEAGFVSDDLWSRSDCTSIAVTKEQKRLLANRLEGQEGHECYVPGISTEDDSVVLVYGDEHESVAHSLSEILLSVCLELGLKSTMDSYN